MRSIRLFSMLFLLLVGWAVAGCVPGPAATDAPPAAPTSASEQFDTALRIHNSGDQDITNLTVIFPNERIVFGDVVAGETTEYKEAVVGVYNYGAYEYEVDGQIVSQPVIDWVGESPKTGALFTYEIRYNPGQPQMLAIELVQVTSE